MGKNDGKRNPKNASKGGTQKQRGGIKKPKKVSVHKMDVMVQVQTSSGFSGHGGNCNRWHAPFFVHSNAACMHAYRASRYA
eukprot:1157397-Pelagomonas_calceolata.AAC.4